MIAHCTGCGAEIDVELAPLAEVPRELLCATCDPPTRPDTPHARAAVGAELLDDGTGARVKVEGSFD